MTPDEYNYNRDNNLDIANLGDIDWDNRCDLYDSTGRMIVSQDSHNY